MNNPNTICDTCGYSQAQQPRLFAWPWECFACFAQRCGYPSNDLAHTNWHEQSLVRDAARWRMLCKLFHQWDRPRIGECGTFDIFLPCKTPSQPGCEHIIQPEELAEILDGFIAKEKS